MIITGSRIATLSGAGAVGSHVLNGPANERIDVLQGCQADLNDMVTDAETHGARYALRHWKVSPKEGMTTADARVVAADLAKEFGADPSRLMIVEHQKPRAGGAGYERHWHVIAPEVDPVAGRVLDSSWMRPRHEKLARIAEERLGHALVPGRWNAAVARAIAEQRPELAERVAAAAQQTRPESGYTAAQHQVAARHGRSMPDDRLAVATAWQGSDSPLAFAAALAEQGISVRAGHKAGTFIAERDGQLIGAIHRLTGEKKEQVSERLAGADFQPVLVPEQPPIDAGNPIFATPVAAQPTPAAEHDQAIPKTTPTVAQTEEAGPTQDATGGAKNTAAHTRGGGGAAPAATETGGTGASLEDVGDGPGPPPGPGASPDERAKWLAKLTAHDDRKAAAWARWIASQKPKAEAPTTINKAPAGENNVDIRKQTETGAEKIRGALYDLGQASQRANKEAEATRSDSNAGNGNDRVPSSARTAGVGNAHGDARAGEPGGRIAARVGDTEGEGRAESDRRIVASHAGGDGKPTQDRGEDRQAFRRLAAQAGLVRGLEQRPDTMAALRRARLELDPAYQARRVAHGRIRSDRMCIAKILATHPHPDPADQDPDAREQREERAARDTHRADRTAQATATGTAVKAAFQNRSPLTWMRNVVLEQFTAKQQQILDAAGYAERNANTRPDDDTLKAARERGRLFAMGARDRTASWEARPDVAVAIEQDRLNQVVDEAAKVGDPAIVRSLKAGDPEAARAIVQSREESYRRIQEALEIRQGIQRPVKQGPPSS